MASGKMFAACILASMVLIHGCCDRTKSECRDKTVMTADAEGTVAVASSFGWNADDATAALQAAIDSGAKKVIIDRQKGDWIIQPVLLRSSNQEVVVADGVTVRAKKGCFKGRNDCLFAVTEKVKNLILRGEGNAVLVMNKKDYQNQDEYAFSEWRHTVSIRGGSNISVSNLTLLASGGDGVYVRGAAKNVRLDKLVCRDHHRQGISVISAVDLHVTNCRFDETSGAAPQCGVDLEPNLPNDRLENVVFEDCVFNGNASSGIYLHLHPLNGTTRPISVTFRRCVSRGNDGNGIRLNCVGPQGDSVRGFVAFEDCKTQGNTAHAFVVTGKRSDRLDIIVKNCTFDVSEGGLDAVHFDNSTFLDDFGGISFDNVKAIMGKGKSLVFAGADGVGVAPETMKGELVAVRKGVEEKLPLREFALKHPQNPEALAAIKSFRILLPDYRKLNINSDAPILAASASTGWLRRRFIFVQYVPKAGDYPVVFRTKPLGKRRASLTVQQLDAAGTDLGTFKVNDAVFTNVIRATGAALRRFEVKVEGGLCAVESDLPGQGLQADRPVSLFAGRNRRYYFLVPADSDTVSAEIKPEEACSARLVRVDGTIADEKKKSVTTTILKCKREKTAKDEVWCLEFPYVQEDASFRIGYPASPFVAADPSTVLRLK